MDSDIKVPELAEFAGRDTTSFDINGPWKMSNAVAIADAGTPGWVGSTFDDSAWVSVPDDDHRMLMPQGELALRDTFTLDAAHSALTHLYVWSLNSGCPAGSVVRAWIDGAPLTVEFPLNMIKDNVRTSPQWQVYAAPAGLASSKHTLALANPACTAGHPLGYRVYLSSTPPAQFPKLAAGPSARWVDFLQWYAQLHLVSISDGMESIRQLEPDKEIELMAPNDACDTDKLDAIKWGGVFHDTGFMGASWFDLLPSLMRSSGLPASAEPGGPATDVPGFKRQLALWLTEGVNGISYFIHIGSVIDNPDIKTQYETDLPMLKALGKHHIPKGQVAALVSHESARLQGFPWVGDINQNQDPGTSTAWWINQTLTQEYDIDAITPNDLFPGGAAAR